MSEEKVDLSHFDRILGTPYMRQLLSVNKEVDRQSDIDYLTRRIEQRKHDLFQLEIQQTLVGVETSSLGSHGVEKINQMIEQIKDQIEKDTIDLDGLLDL